MDGSAGRVKTSNNSSPSALVPGSLTLAGREGMPRKKTLVLSCSQLLSANAGIRDGLKELLKDAAKNETQVKASPCSPCLQWENDAEGGIRLQESWAPQG